MTIVQTIFAVFTSISEWFVETIASLTPIFYAEGSLTFLGTLALCSLGIGIIMLVINRVVSFIQFRG